MLMENKSVLWTIAKAMKLLKDEQIWREIHRCVLMGSFFPP